LWDARTIAQLRHQEIITSQQRLLERRRGDDKVLKEILVDISVRVKNYLIDLLKAYEFGYKRNLEKRFDRLKF